MIRVNCQYNVGGYRLFKLCYGPKMEYFLSEKSENATDAPQESVKYVNQAGVKFIYQHLQSGGYVVVLTNIESIYKDDSGRPTKSAVIFSGDESDRETMDNIALDILNNQPKFEKFFKDLFSFYDGFNVQYDGEKLAEYVRCMERKKQYEGKSELSNIPNKKNGILCMIPIYPHWTDDAREKIKRELKLEVSSITKTIILTQDQWNKAQGSLTISDIPIIEPKDESDNLFERKTDVDIEDNEPTKKQKTRARTCLIACQSVLLAYISAWRWLISKDKEKDPELMKAFLFSQITILLLIIAFILFLVCKIY